MTLTSVTSHFASADSPTVKDPIWIEQQWDTARLLANRGHEVLLVLDEVQKIRQWSEVVKKMWDDDSRAKIPIKVVLLGSSSLLLQSGLTESLAGRFEIIPVTHWSYSEMKTAFGFTLDQYIYYGGYPGAAELIHDHQRWKRYILDSLIETTISRDILMMTRVDKPILLRRLFELGCTYSGQILSYQKMMGQLQDAGNVTTLAHYLALLTNAGMVTGLQKYSSNKLRQRGSSPKLQVLNTALLSALDDSTFEQTRNDPARWGRYVESAVGAHLINTIQGKDSHLYYWREGNNEVDFVIKEGKRLTAIEVKSNFSGYTTSAIQAFDQAFKPQNKLLIGDAGIKLETYLSTTF